MGFRIAVISENYVRPDNLYANAFVHTRVKAYLQHFREVHVLAGLVRNGVPGYVLDGVTVHSPQSIEEGLSLLMQLQPDVLCVHFPSRRVIEGILRRVDCPLAVWIHGFEGLGWYRRVGFYPELNSLRGLLRYVKANVLQLWSLRRFLLEIRPRRDCAVVFISEWMKRTTESDCWLSLPESAIIPNPIDENQYPPVPKPPELRKRVLMIRPFFSKKYATDIFAAALALLRERPGFADVRFTVVGEGAARSPLAEDFAGLPNVVVLDRYVSQREIKELHDQHGIFIALTRQDAQGVSMCEAMASGLVVVTSNNTAIPEFVQHGVSGILTNNEPANVADSLQRLFDDAELFQRISTNAPRWIASKAGLEHVIGQEVALIRSLAQPRS